MIRSFKEAWFEDVVRTGKAPKRFPAELVRSVQRKVAMIAAAVVLEDLRQPPGNRLEALSRDRQGQHSIRVNDQWRLCFVWKDDAAEELEFVDYH